MIGIMAERRLRKNNNTTSITRTTARKRLYSTSRREARMVNERSSTIERSMAFGIEACNWGKRVFTLSTVSIMFAPDCLFNISKTDVFPSLSPAARISSTESVT